MFQNLTGRLSEMVRDLSGRGRLSENNMKTALDTVRAALLEADVALPVIKKFIMNTKQKAIGQKVLKSLSPGQAFISLVQKELVLLMGQANESLDLKAAIPVVILLAGLQGSGKTTTAGKLGRFLKQREKKRVMVVSTDIYRPAAIAQLAVLAQDNDLLYAPSHAGERPVDIVKQALHSAQSQGAEVLIIDTAGRLHIDQHMMQEIRDIHAVAHPHEVLFIVDSMAGQDAVNTAKIFSHALPLTGVILTKADGDARGGAALSIREVTGKPIKFLGVGEKSDALQPFHPERMASRILGMGDVLSLIEEAESRLDREQVQKFAKKMDKGHFDLDDFRQQLRQMSNMGGVQALMDKMPGLGQVPTGAKEMLNDKVTQGMEALINSMTLEERKSPEVIKFSRKQRICKGSGRSIQELNRLLKQFEGMQKMMRTFSQKGGMQGMMRALAGKLPTGMLPPI
jgi:signal recognition particle subunit SRP54